MSKEEITNANSENEKTKSLPEIAGKDMDNTPSADVKTEEPENSENAEKEAAFGKKPIENKPKKEKAVKIKKNRKSLIKKIIKWVIILLILGLVIAVWKIPKLYNFAQQYIPFLPSKSVATSAVGYTTEPVTRRDISETLTGTGTLAAIDSYTVTAKVTGEVLSADFEEMDEVQKGQILYVIESKDLDNSIKEKQESVDEAQEKLDDLLEDYKDLSLYSDLTGLVSEVLVDEGDTVQKDTKIATVFDNRTMLLKVPFFKVDADRLNIGAKATISFDNSGESLTGTVDKISAADSVNSKGVAVKTVTISVTNPGGISESTTAYAKTILSNGETVACTDKGNFSYNVNEAIKASTAGKIEKLYFIEGDYVSGGKLVMKLSSDTLDEQKKSLQHSLDNAKTALDNLLEKKDDYVITAPISGTVVKKNYKALDNIDSTSEKGNTLAVIYDMSKLNFNLSIDELDLNKIEVGQAVEITSDSIDNKFTGYVTKKSIVGTSTNGTTTYPVTVELDGTDLLLPGMNINATIIVKKVENVLSIPVSAVTRGNTVKVLRGGTSGSGTSGSGTSGSGTVQGAENAVDSANSDGSQTKKWSGQKGSATATANEASSQGELQQGSNAADGTKTTKAASDGTSDTTGKTNKSGANGGSASGFTAASGGSNTKNKTGKATEKTTDNIDISKAETVTVELGVSDDDYVEILSGLSEGDIVVIENKTSEGKATTTTNSFGMGGMGGGPMASSPQSYGGGNTVRQSYGESTSKQSTTTTVMK